MKLEPEPLKIGDYDGFKEDIDIFRYAKFGEELAGIVKDLETSSVIVIDGPWGSGKTTFVRQWAGLLRKRGNAVVHFDAFENDHHEDAFFALAGELICAGKAADEATSNAFLTASVNVAKQILPIYADIWARKNLGIGLDDLEKIAKATKDTGSDEGLGEFLKRRIAAVEEQRECLKEFRSKLAKFSKYMKDKAIVEAKEEMGTEKVQDGCNNKLFFIVDELDRCKPTFALSLLERMKHIFQIDGICFVLVTHLDQLEKVVTSEYGSSDASRYLEKFYQLRVTLPSATGNQKQYAKYLHFLIREYWPLTETILVDELVHMLSLLACVHNLSLRTLERILSNIMLVRRMDKFKASGWRPHLVAGLCAMRTVDPALYQEVKRGHQQENIVSKVLEFMGHDDWKNVDIARETSDEMTNQSKEIWTKLLCGEPTGDVHVFSERYPISELRHICGSVDLFHMPLS